MGEGNGPDLRATAATVAALAGVRAHQVAVALGCPGLVARAVGATETAEDGTADVVVAWENPDMTEVARLLRPGGKAVVPTATDTTGWITRYEESGWRVVAVR